MELETCKLKIAISHFPTLPLLQRPALDQRSLTPAGRLPAVLTPNAGTGAVRRPAPACPAYRATPTLNAGPSAPPTPSVPPNLHALATSAATPVRGCAACTPPARSRIIVRCAAAIPGSSGIPSPHAIHRPQVSLSCGREVYVGMSFYISFTRA